MATGEEAPKDVALPDAENSQGEAAVSQASSAVVGKTSTSVSRLNRLTGRSPSLLRRRQQWLIFYHESVRRLAEQLKDEMGDNAELSALQWRRFPDGFPNLSVERQDVHRLEQFFGTCLIVSFHNPEVIFEQLCLLHELPRMRAKNFHVIMPWFCTGTMERVERLGQIATAKSLADMLSCCPVGPGGPMTLVTYDIHWLQEQFYFSDPLLVELRTAVPLCLELLSRARAAAPDEEVVVAFPDEGAHKKMKDTFKDYPFVICDKVRDGARRIVTIIEGQDNIAGKHCVIIDDMVMSGALMLECAQQLHSMGAARISCFTVHAVMPKQAWKKFIDTGILHRFWITDTMPSTADEVRGVEPFEVITIAPLVASYLLGYGET